MARYRIVIKPSAVKEIEAIRRKRDRQRIVRRIERLAEDPRPPGCRKLSGLEWYRVRQGAYRVVYGIDDDHRLVRVLKVGDRKEIYRDR